MFVGVYMRSRYVAWAPASSTCFPRVALNRGRTDRLPKTSKLQLDVNQTPRHLSIHFDHLMTKFSVDPASGSNPRCPAQSDKIVRIRKVNAKLDYKLACIVGAPLAGRLERPKLSDARTNI